VRPYPRAGYNHSVQRPYDHFEIRAECWQMNPIERVLQDLKYALRQLSRAPGLAGAAIVSLTLGIGANTAIFSALNAVLLRSLPVPAATELFKLTKEAPLPVVQRFSYRTFQELRDAAGPGNAAAMSQSTRVNMSVGEGTQAERANAQLVSGEFFRVLSVSAALGRVLEPEDDRAVSAHPVAVLSHSYWKDRFGAAPDVLGKTVALNGSRFTVVGVASDGFKGVFLETPTDIWIPTMMQSDIRYHQNFSADSADPEKPWIPQDGIIWLDVLVRASRDAKDRLATSLEAAFRQRLTLQAESIGDPDQRKRFLDSRLVLDSFSQGRSRLRERFTPVLYALMGLVVLVLLIACANTANLLLARSAARQREIAVRLSIGAGRARLIQQLLTESFVLSGIAAVGGLLLAWWSAGALVGMVVRSVPGSSESIVNIDARVLAFTVAISLLTGLLFGLAPAFRATGLDLCTSLKSGGRVVEGRMRWNPGKLAIGVQVALSLLLVTAAGLFGRSLYNLAHVNLGFDRDRVVSVGIDSRNAGVPISALPAFYARVLEQVESVPGVKSAAFAECDVAGGCRSASDGMVISGYTPAPLERVTFQENRVSAEYLPTVGIRLLRGRPFDVRDRKDAPRVAIVNQTLVHRYFAGRDPIGQKFGYQTPDTEIIGVIADARVYSAREPAEPMAYYPLEQQMLFATAISVRVSGDPRQALDSVRDAIRRAAPILGVERISTLGQQVDNGLVADRLVAVLASAFGALAVGLACLGLYGLLSYSVARRTSEIGVRMALGARPMSVLSEILVESMGLIVVGLLAGLPLAAGGGRLISSILFGVSPWDALTLTFAILTLSVLGLSAAFIPAWRASRIDPLIALRRE
jgi:putative ABC transport system permease protein